jgi:hypothetical protein
LVGEAIRQGRHGPIGLHSQLAAQQRRVHLRVANRARTIAAARQRVHQRDRVRGAEWIDGGYPTAMLHGERKLTARFALRGQRFERSQVAPGETNALLLDPPLKLGGIGDEKSVEERAGVESYGAIERVSLERLLELADVARELAGSHGEIVSRPDGDFASQVASQLVQQLRERVPNARFVAIGPEQRQNAVASNGRVARQRENRQQREAAALGVASRERSSVTLEHDRTEGPKPYHWRT